MADKLRRKDHEGKTYYRFYCPGCKHGHIFEVPRWHFDGDMERPTFHPSLLNYYDDPETKKRVVVCHLFLKAGKIQFLNDCPHELKGQTVDLPEFPKDYA